MAAVLGVTPSGITRKRTGKSTVKPKRTSQKGKQTKGKLTGTAGRSKGVTPKNSNAGAATAVPTLSRRPTVILDPDVTEPMDVTAAVKPQGTVGRSSGGPVTRSSRRGPKRKATENSRADEASVPPTKKSKQDSVKQYAKTGRKRSVGKGKGKGKPIPKTMSRTRSQRPSSAAQSSATHSGRSFLILLHSNENCIALQHSSTPVKNTVVHILNSFQRNYFDLSMGANSSSFSHMSHMTKADNTS